ncbi:urease accessory protein UreD [Roseobacter sp. HKCCA0434]|uniref:urease accessory protein UreD n=1 Tax=Roseobacter sp. HKCCA0434 TaxID=3079297 RepID=UPI0029059B8E|nr:urease accessory protein UreD [Roseobacter sp. HKCCA0434]
MARYGSDGFLTDLRQQGSGKVMLPRSYGVGPEVVFVNTSGGVTGGDRFEWRLGTKAGHVTGTTQAAERLYRASGGRGTILTRLEVAEGARLDWVPMETILFDGCAVDRRIEVELAGDATFLGAEAIVLGRAAMGERLRAAHFTDSWRIRRDGKLVQAEALRLSGPLSGALDGSATLGGIRAFATIILSAPGAMDRLEEMRRLAPEGVTVGSSAWNGQLVLRLHAGDHRPLKAALMEILTRLRGHALPRVWTM